MKLQNKTPKTKKKKLGLQGNFNKKMELCIVHETNGICTYTPEKHRVFP